MVHCALSDHSTAHSCDKKYEPKEWIWHHFDAILSTFLCDCQPRTEWLSTKKLNFGTIMKIAWWFEFYLTDYFRLVNIIVKLITVIVGNGKHRSFSQKVLPIAHRSHKKGVADCPHSQFYNFKHNLYLS
jgi:hypothetical protein